MKTVALYVKAGRETGYGHIVRSLTLADELRAQGALCEFMGNPLIVSRVTAAGFTAYGGSGSYFEENYLKVNADAWIVDLEGGCPPELAAQLRDRCKVLGILNGVGYPDGDPGRLLADLVFYQGVTRRPHELDWTGFRGEWHEGPRWLILREDFRSVQANPGAHDPPRVVVACGGSDPKDVTGCFLDAFKSVKDIRLQAIVGPSNGRSYQEYGHNTAVWHDPPDMARALAWADVACVSYGMTAFECLALGLPTVALSVSPDHATSAELASRRSRGALAHLGEVENVGAADIRAAVLEALGDVERRSRLAGEFVDGRGAGRVADRIMEKLCAAS
jgi:UDP-2,4-diacetamido-2,4,6-trideoxy-beta-L-altropyranose hydrolase